MLRNLLTIMDVWMIITVANCDEFVNLVDELLKDGGKWILASAGTTGVEPPNEACVHVMVTDTGKQSECILANHNLSPHRAKIVEFFGINEDNRIEIISRGPIQQYMIKGYLNSNNVHSAVKDEVDWDAAINSPMCWLEDTHKTNDFRYIIAPIDNTTEHILLVGVRVRMPAPEYQVAIMTKTKIESDKLDKMTIDVNYRNHVSLKKKCMMNYKDQTVYPTNITLPPYCLPSIHKRCAEGIHWNYNSESGLYVIPSNIKELETVVVKHLN